MSRFLFTTLPTNDLGLIVRSLPIARELCAAGHSVVCSNPAAAPRRLIAAAGFANVLSDHPLYQLLGGRATLGALAAYIRAGSWRQRHARVRSLLGELLPAIPLRRARPTAEVWSMGHAGAIMGLLDAGFVRANCRALLEVIRQAEPDVIVDFWNPFAAIAARVAGIPLVTVIQADAHPLARGFIWWQGPPPPFPEPTATLNRVLAEYGLPRIQRSEDLSVGDLTLVVGSPETDPLPPAANVKYIGAVLWQQSGAELPEWLRQRDRERPLVWVYSGNPNYGGVGGTLDSAVVLEACIAGLAGEEIEVVLTTGYHRLPVSLPALPANMRHEPFLPGLAMAGLSNALVHHGGFGSCQLGLHAGKPAVIIPTYSERESNARRLHALGAAELVAVHHLRGRKHVDAALLRGAVRRVLTVPSYAECARKAGDTLARYGGARGAAQHIAAFALEHCRREG